MNKILSGLMDQKNMMDTSIEICNTIERYGVNAIIDRLAWYYTDEMKVSLDSEFIKRCLK